MEEMNVNYLEATIKQFQYYKLQGEKTFAQLTDDQLFWQANPECNSIATIVKHLHGNMLSRWTDFLTSDGEKEWRERDGEFVNDIASREVMLEKWEEGWQCLFDAIGTLQPEDLTKTVYIRNQGHTVLEAIQRQFAHYTYHIGQIVYAGKILAGADWKSLSIPRNQSADYNREKFSEEKQRRHFTDEYLDSSQ